MLRFRGYGWLLLLLTSMSLWAQTPNITAGRQTYLGTCAACHGPDPRTNITASVANNPDALFFTILGIPTMRFLANALSDQDLVNVTAYIGSVVSPAPTAFAHESGWYWDPAQGGRGYFYEKKASGSVFMAGFIYETNGRALWFTAQGNMNGNVFTSPMSTFTGGQTLTGPYRAPTAGPVLGTLTLTFTSNNTARLVMPGTDINLVRFPFATGSVQAPPQAGSPEKGWYWFASEGGRGYAIEIQGNQVFIIAFMYDDQGNPIWYLASGAMATPTRFEGVWSTFANGQALGQPYRAPVVANANAGSLVINFSSSTGGTLTLPDGRQIGIVRFPF